MTIGIRFYLATNFELSAQSTIRDLNRRQKGLKGALSEAVIIFFKECAETVKKGLRRPSKTPSASGLTLSHVALSGYSLPLSYSSLRSPLEWAKLKTMRMSRRFGRLP